MPPSTELSCAARINRDRRSNMHQSMKSDRRLRELISTSFATVFRFLEVPSFAAVLLRDFARVLFLAVSLIMSLCYWLCGESQRKDGSMLPLGISVGYAVPT
jgi:hypothetical protein